VSWVGRGKGTLAAFPADGASPVDEPGPVVVMARGQNIIRRAHPECSGKAAGAGPTALNRAEMAVKCDDFRRSWELGKNREGLLRKTGKMVLDLFS
jgi:hypothetical protein